jgi:hypothetical protein
MDEGEVQAPFHQEKSKRCMLLTLRDHVGQKVRVRARPSWRVGGMEANTPTHAKWSHATLRHL